jgi:hypothetical protein
MDAAVQVAQNPIFARTAMKCRILFCAVLFGVFAFGKGNSGAVKQKEDAAKQPAADKVAPKIDSEDEAWLPAELHQIDANDPRWTRIVRVGDIVQFESEKGSKTSGTVNTEVAGDCVSVVSRVVELPGNRVGSLLKAEKVGTATVIITPLLDGKANEEGRRKFVIHVEERLKRLRETFIQLDTNRPPKGKKPWREPTMTGDWIQFHVVCSTVDNKRGDIVRDLRVEIDGDAVEKIAVLTSKVRTGPDFARNTGSGDPHRRGFSCLAKAVKKGVSKVTITPISEDGKSQDARVIIIDVVGDPRTMRGN